MPRLCDSLDDLRVLLGKPIVIINRGDGIEPGLTQPVRQIPVPRQLSTVRIA